jgi:hypothetical protein
MWSMQSDEVEWLGESHIQSNDQWQRTRHEMTFLETSGGGCNTLITKNFNILANYSSFNAFTSSKALAWRWPVPTSLVLRIGSILYKCNDGTKII